MRENSLQTAGSGKKDGKEVLQALEQRFFSPAAHDLACGEAGCPL